MTEPRRPRIVGLDLRAMQSGFLQAHTLREELMRLRAAGAEVALWRSHEHGATTPWPERIGAALARWQPDLVLVERVWRRDVLEAGRAAVPGAAWVRPASSVPMPLDALLDRVEGMQGLLQWVREGTWPDAPAESARTAAALRLERDRRAPPAEVLPELDLEGDIADLGRPTIRGPVDGCPFLLDAAANPVYAGLDLSDVQRKGCTYCLDNTGAYQLPQTSEFVATWLAQLEAQHAHLGRLREVLIADERPHPHLPALMQALIERPHLHGIRFFWKSRVDWLAQFEGNALDAACKLATRSNSVLDLYLIGFENFADSALLRMNKGVRAADNFRAVEIAEQLAARHPHSFRWEDSKGHGIILFTPWTTPDELQANAEAMAAVRFERFRAGALRTRLRIYPNLPLHKLAQRDGLLADAFEAGTDRAAEQGYNASLPWRFADRATAVIWQFCDQVGARLAPHQPEHAALAEAVRWGRWLAPAHDLQPLLAWQAWDRAGRPSATAGADIADGELAGLQPGQWLSRSLPGSAESLAAVYERLGFATRATAHAVHIALEPEDLPAQGVGVPPQPLDLHVWALLPQGQGVGIQWLFESDGLLGTLPTTDGLAWPALRVRCEPMGLRVVPMWPDPTRWSDATARRAALQRAIAWLQRALTPGSVLTASELDLWPEAERWPLPVLRLEGITAIVSPLLREGDVWSCLIALHTSGGVPHTLRMSALPSAPISEPAARTDHRWLVHDALPEGLPVRWPVLFRQLAGWWAACERGAADQLALSVSEPPDDR